MEQEPLVDGFSSEEEFKEEEIYIKDERITQAKTIGKEEIRYRIQPAPQIKNKPYPLHPDITSGWVPRILLPNPVPTIYENYIVNALVQELLKPNQQLNYKIAYLGARYENSYFIHYSKPYHFPYLHIRPPDHIKFSNRSFLGNNPDCCDDLGFDSLFESGNLDCAVKVGLNEYGLFLQVDSNTKGHLQWYNYKISRAKKGSKYRFHICNFQKSKSLYTRGMKPFVFSKQRHKQLWQGWEQCGENLKYELRSLRFRTIFDSDVQKYYRLSFDYTFEYDNDQVQFAYCVPYEYTTLLKWIEQLNVKCADMGFLKVTKLCNSLGALQVPLLIIHQPDPPPQDEVRITENRKSMNASQEDLRSQFMRNYPSPRKCIVISGRAHPGQSNGSFMMQGFVEFLCGSSPAAIYLRKRVVFKVVPMLNPDGVVAGNYRTGLSGKDFNRQFLNPDRFVFPEITALKDLVIKYKKQYKNNLLLFLDFHGHSIKKNVFMYGPEFPITDRYYYESKILPKMLGRSTEMFSFKETTARAILLKKLDIPFSYTIEASNGSYFDKEEMKDIKFNPKLWIEMGHHIGKTIHEYCEAFIINRELRVEKQKERQVVFNHKKKKSWMESRRTNNYSTSSPIRSVNKRSSYIEKTSKLEPTTSNCVEGFLKQIVEEIKQAQMQQQKNKQVISDDAMSEGSSDQEKDDDDLSPDRYRKLCKIIASKKFQGLQKCKFTSKEYKAQTPSPTLKHPVRQMSSKSIPYGIDDPIMNNLNHDSIGNLMNIIINNNSEEEGEAEQQEADTELPPIGQVFTNRISFKQKLLNKHRAMNETMRQTVNNRPVAKISNISFLEPYCQDERRTVIMPNRRERPANSHGELNLMVDSLRRTYNIFKDTTITHSRQLTSTSMNKSLFKHHQFKTKLKHQRRSVNY